MSTFAQKIADGFTRTIQLVKQTANDLNGKIGVLTGLDTVNKSSLVTAINETLGIAKSKAAINDTATSATTTYSSNKIDASINTAITGLIGGADINNDTLKELADKITAVAQSDAGLVSAIAAQSFTASQQLQARANIGAAAAADLGDLTGVDFVADINTAFANGS